MTAARLVLLSTSPRVAPGLLSSDAWSALRAGPVLTGAADHPATPYLEAAGVHVEVASRPSTADLAAHLVASANSHGTVVWLVGADGDPGLGLALPAALAAVDAAPELEFLPGSYDLPGQTLLDLVAVMDRLRSEDGCPWDALQTHESLVTYLLEETYETIEAIETGDLAHLREELGDLLLQIVFHARIASEHPDQPWSIDDVAADIVAKLIRRHPHVFRDDAELTTAEEVEASWHTRKAAEKSRDSAVDGVPMALPALSLAGKLMHRARSHGVVVDAADDGGIGSRLMLLVAEAQSAGLDAETELRAAAHRYASRVRDSEV